MPQEKKPINQNLTVPNALSVLRIIVTPFFAWFFMQDQLAIAVALLVLSGLSDCVDGFIARKLNQVTELGKMLDPLADKLTQGVVALCLAIKFPVICPALLVFILKDPTTLPMERPSRFVPGGLRFYLLRSCISDDCPTSAYAAH